MPEWVEVVWGKNDGDVGFIKLSQLKLDSHEKPAKIQQWLKLKRKWKQSCLSKTYLYT